MNKYSEERKEQQEKGNIPSFFDLYSYCLFRFNYDEDQKGLVIKNTRQARGKVGDRPGSKRKDSRVIIHTPYGRYFEHTLVWLMFNGKLPENQLDHINRDPTDNRIENLREATNKENCCNRDLQSNNTSGFKGVHERKDLKIKKFGAYIKNAGKLIRLGYFRTKEEAAMAYDKAAEELFGDFAKLNFEA